MQGHTASVLIAPHHTSAARGTGCAGVALRSTQAPKLVPGPVDELDVEVTRFGVEVQLTRAAGTGGWHPAGGPAESLLTSRPGIPLGPTEIAEEGPPVVVLAGDGAIVGIHVEVANGPE